jgi:hypothetical protein
MKVGRKRMGEERAVLVSFRIPGEWMEKLRRLAGERKLGELLRDAVRRLVE